MSQFTSCDLQIILDDFKKTKPSKKKFTLGTKLMSARVTLTSDVACWNARVANLNALVAMSEVRGQRVKRSDVEGMVRDIVKLSEMTPVSQEIVFDLEDRVSETMQNNGLLSKKTKDILSHVRKVNADVLNKGRILLNRLSQ